jgi:hypothetical protein
MIAKGTFDVKLTPQQDEETPAGRMTIYKTFSGEMEGKGKGQMISKRLENGTAVYFAIEEFEGTISGKSCSFTFMHKGAMSKESQSLEITILDGSGSGELETISGSMSVVQDGGAHSYELKYAL